MALATVDSELFVTYPATVQAYRCCFVMRSCRLTYADNPQVTPLDASTMADFLSRSLRLDAMHLFQV